MRTFPERYGRPHQVSRCLRVSLRRAGAVKNDIDAGERDIDAGTGRQIPIHELDSPLVSLAAARQDTNLTIGCQQPTHNVSPQSSRPAGHQD